MFFERFVERPHFVVNRPIKAERFGEVAAFFGRARNPHHAHPQQFANLPHDRTHRPRRARNDQRFACFGLANVEQTKISSQANHAEETHVGIERQAAVPLEAAEATAVADIVFLPVD